MVMLVYIYLLSLSNVLLFRFQIPFVHHVMEVLSKRSNPTISDEVIHINIIVRSKTLQTIRETSRTTMEDLKETWAICLQELTHCSVGLLSLPDLSTLTRYLRQVSLQSMMDRGMRGNSTQRTVTGPSVSDSEILNGCSLSSTI